MDPMLAFDAVLFPADDRPPHLVALMTSPLSMPISNPPEPFRCGRVPHPEMYMDYIAEGLGPRSWRFKVRDSSAHSDIRPLTIGDLPWRLQVVEQLEGMNKKFPSPYIVFYPTVSRDGMPFPANKCAREVQGRCFNEANAWRGNIILAKYRDLDYSAMMDASMADFPILKNWLSTNIGP